MANIRSEEATAELHRKILTAATALFMQKGFERTTFVDIAKLSDVPKSKILYEFASKEEILSLLVTEFLDGVAKASDAVSKKLTDDKLLIFMANEVLQIYMAEMSDDKRNLYLAGYSMPKTSEEVLKRRTEILYREFGNMLPYLELKDFYELEIASMGIMRAYMSVPCSMYFTLEAKTDRLISTILKIYDIDNKRIEEVKEFMKKIDFEAVAKKTVEDVFEELGIKTNK
ncbi:MAG: TetR/AcrR family transcriptional regulator [Clostridia bacterium]|nr:TetR/AcrR family transcriptional regulator [Clostridia bacterium]